MRNVLVTGCSSGFGLLAAVELARAGLRVFATMRDLSRRERLEAAAREAGVTVELLALDVTDERSIEGAVAEVEREGGVDVVVNNAGFGMAGFAHDVTLAEYREQFETNVFGLIAVTKACLGPMIARRRGRVVNVSSIAGRVAVPGLGAYSASKFAVEGFTESLRLEVAPFGLWASLVEPGTFKTDIFERNRREAKGLRDPSSPHAEQVRTMEAQVEKMLASSTADPRDVARTIVEAATAARPHLRYLVGTDAKAQAVMKQLLPAPLFERAVLGYLGQRRGGAE